MTLTYCISWTIAVWAVDDLTAAAAAAGVVVEAETRGVSMVWVDVV